MLSRIELTNIGSFDHLVVDLHKGNNAKHKVLILGASGNGKSSLIQALDRVYQSLSSYPDTVLLGQSDGWSDYLQTNHRFISPASHSAQASSIKLNFIVSHAEFGYELKFDAAGKLTGELCTCRRSKQEWTLFSVSDHFLFLNMNSFSEDQLLIIHAGMHGWGEYTLLSFLKDVGQNENGRMGKLYYDLHQALSFFNHWTVYPDLELMTKGIDLFSGVIDLSRHSLLDWTREALNLYLKGIVKEIASVDYRIEANSVNQLSYALCITYTNGYSLRGSACRDDKSIYALCRSFQVILALSQGDCVCIDDFDAYLDHFTFTYLVGELLDFSRGQLIATMNTTMVMAHESAGNCYLIRGQQCQAIDQIVRTQPNNNNRVRYEKGVFGSTKFTVSDEFQEAIKQLLRFLNP